MGSVASIRDAEERIPGCAEGRPVLPTLALLRDHRDACLKKQISKSYTGRFFFLSRNELGLWDLYIFLRLY